MKAHLKRLILGLVFFSAISFPPWGIAGIDADLVNRIKAASVTVGGNKGSAVVINHKGKIYALTAYHVVSNFINYFKPPAWEDQEKWEEKRLPIVLNQSLYVEDTKVSVTSLMADIEAYEIRYDLALLKIRNPTEVVATTLALQNPRIGSDVFTVSTPADLEATLSQGILSGKGRILSNWRRNYDLTAWQHSAPVFFGSSGSGLFNNQGELIGITVGGIRGVNIYFAVPLPTLKKFLETVN